MFIDSMLPSQVFQKIGDTSIESVDHISTDTKVAIKPIAEVNITSKRFLKNVLKKNDNYPISKSYSPYFRQSIIQTVFH